MSPGLARLTGRSLPSVHMGNFSPVRELRFQPGYMVLHVHMGNFSSVTEMNKARHFKFHSGNRAWSVHMGKFLARLPGSRYPG